MLNRPSGNCLVNRIVKKAKKLMISARMITKYATIAYGITSSQVSRGRQRSTCSG